MSHVSFYQADTTLFLKESDVVAHFLENFSSESIELVEGALGIEFAYKDGTYQEDGPPEGANDDEWESQGIDCETYREGFLNNEAPGLPESYPAILVCGELGGDGGTVFYTSTWVYPENFEHAEQD